MPEPLANKDDVARNNTGDASETVNGTGKISDNNSVANSEQQNRLTSKNNDSTTPADTAGTTAGTNADNLDEDVQTSNHQDALNESKKALPSGSDSEHGPTSKVSRSAEAASGNSQHQDALTNASAPAQSEQHVEPEVNPQQPALSGEHKARTANATSKHGNKTPETPEPQTTDFGQQIPATPAAKTGSGSSSNGDSADSGAINTDKPQNGNTGNDKSSDRQASRLVDCLLYTSPSPRDS